jgi:hypothetical protein
MTLMQRIFADLIRANPPDPRHPRAIFWISSIIEIFRGFFREIREIRGRKEVVSNEL